MKITASEARKFSDGVNRLPIIDRVYNRIRESSGRGYYCASLTVSCSSVSIANLRKQLLDDGFTADIHTMPHSDPSNKITYYNIVVKW